MRDLEPYQFHMSFSLTPPPLRSDQRGTRVGVLLRRRATGAEGGQNAGVVGGQGEEGGGETGAGEHHVLFREEVAGPKGIMRLTSRPRPPCRLGEDMHEIR